MKKHKILSLLLALVLVFSAAGTAFAASNSVPAGAFGNLTGTINQDPPVGGQWSVTLTASIDYKLNNTMLSMSVHWGPTSDPTYATADYNKLSISHTYLVPFTLDWEPTHAYGYYQVYAPTARSYYTEASIPVTRPA